MNNDSYLINDEGVDDDEVLTIQDDIQNLSIQDDRGYSSTDYDIGVPDTQRNSHLGFQLGTSKEYSYSSNTVLKGSYTLRECNKLYGKSFGCKWEQSSVPEFDRCYTKGCISPLRRFINIVGHFSAIKNDENTAGLNILCFTPEICNSFGLFKDSLSKDIGRSMRFYKLWNLSNCKQYTQQNNGSWLCDNLPLDSKLSTALSLLGTSFTDPLSAHTQHAYYEAEDSKDIFHKLKVFVQPEETTAGPGIFGTLHNNQQIDLAQEENSKNIDIEARYNDVDIPGFLCAGHTAHSTEAGRVRRVCCDVSIRVLNNDLLNKLYKGFDVAEKMNDGKKEWLLFCMGKMIYCTTKALLSLRNFIRSSSSMDINSATININTEMHTAIISISSGVLLRRDSNDNIISTMSLYSDSWPDNKYNLEIPAIDSETGLRFYFSSFFQLTPYIVFDRPPRTLISSVQSIQAVTAPYGAGTSSVAPSHISKPLVTTPLAEALLTNPEENNPQSKFADLVPGEDLMVAFTNFNDTVEDSIMISSDAADRGLYAHMAYSRHLISSSEKVPDIGEYVNMYENRWWKTYSRRTDKPPTKNPNLDIKPLLAGGDGTGKVISKNTTDTGQLSVKVLRYSTPVTGDKLATGHGQKGVIKWTKSEDMPWGIDENGEILKFDIIISVASISNRLTVGQYYEMVSGAKAAREGKRLIISPGTIESNHTETVLYDGKTGELIEKPTEKDEPILVSWGISRVWQMTQLTWDKQHYTHNTAGKYSIATSTGRTAGGGLRFGEMESHAIEASGLTAPAYELKRRMDCINTSFCLKYDRLVQLCLCETDEFHVKISIPHSMLVFGYASLLTSGHILKFKIDT